MVLRNPQGDIVSSLERICPQGLSLLTLVGAHDELYAIDTSSLSLNTQVTFVVTSPPQLEADRLESANLRRSSRASLAAISFIMDDSWTNTSLAATICNFSPTTVTSLSLTCPATATKWYRLPTCISTFVALTQITITGCQTPVLNALPLSLTRIVVQGAYGSWTQRDAGVNPTGPNASYFDWSWLSSVPNLQILLLDPQSFNGTMPNEFNHSKMAGWYLGGPSTPTIQNRLVGTISPNWFIQYPATQLLDVSYNNLTGTVPNYGMEKLQTLTLSSNQFTHWPPLIINATAGFGPPSNLASVSLDYNNLVQIPSESDFQAMQLTTFDVTSNPSLSSTFPNVFASTTQRTLSTLVVRVLANGCQFYGTLPEIPAYQAALYASTPATLMLTLNKNNFTGSIPSSWSNVKFSWMTLDGNPLQGRMATIDSNGLVTSQPVLDASVLLLSSDFVTGPMFNISAMADLSSLRLDLPNVDFCASSRAGFSFASKNLSTCVLIGNATMCPEAYPSSCTIVTSPVAPVVAPVPQTPHNPRQMKGYFYTPLPGYVYFDITEMEGIGGCIYLGAAGATPQAGGIYMRIAQCNDTSLTALIASGCGTSAQTFPISNTSYTTGQELTGSMFSTFNGVTYTEYSVSCYDPTPSQVLAPIPPQAPVPLPANDPVSDPASEPHVSEPQTPPMESPFFASPRDSVAPLFEPSPSPTSSASTLRAASTLIAIVGAAFVFGSHAGN